MALLGFDDPQQSAMLALAAGLLGAPSLGQGLSRGLLGGMQAYNQGQDAAMKRAYQQSLMEDRQAQLEERRLKLAEAERLRKAREDFMGALRTTPQLAPNFDMRDQSTWQKLPYHGEANDVQKLPMQAGASFGMPQDLVLRGLAAGYSIDQLRAMAESGNWGRPKVARTIDATDAKGLPTTRQFDEYGNQIGAELPKAVERKTLDIGGSILDRNPFTGEVYGTTKKTMTPGETASNQLGWANNRVSQGQLGVAQAGLQLRQQELNQGKWQYDAARGGLVNLQSGEFRPATQDGKPIGAKEQPITESQANANLYASRAAEANRILADLEKGGVKDSGRINQALSQAPFVGGGLAAINNALPGVLGGPSGNQQRYGQAKRDFINAVLRKESGAVISQSEFDNADKQYFPQIGDEPEVIAQKARNREIALQGLAVAAGPAMGRNPPAAVGGWKYLGKE